METAVLHLHVKRCGFRTLRCSYTRLRSLIISGASISRHPMRFSNNLMMIKRILPKQQPCSTSHHKVDGRTFTENNQILSLPHIYFLHLNTIGAVWSAKYRHVSPRACIFYYHCLRSIKKCVDWALAKKIRPNTRKLIE